jgi:hypothetical protein
VVLDQFKAVNKRDFDRWRHLILGYGLRPSHRRDGVAVAVTA